MFYQPILYCKQEGVIYELHGYKRINIKTDADMREKMLKRKEMFYYTDEYKNRNNYVEIFTCKGTN